MQSVKYRNEIKPEYLEKVKWDVLSENPNAIHLLEKNMDEVVWKELSKNPNAIHLLKENIEKVNWEEISYNPNVLYILCGIDYEAMKEAMKPLAEELAQRINNPRKYSSQEEFLQRQVELGFLEIEDIE